MLDDLSTGFCFAVPDEVPFYQDDIPDSVLLKLIFLEQGIGAVMHFAGSVVVPESVDDPLAYYDNNTVRSRALVAQSGRSLTMNCGDGRGFSVLDVLDAIDRVSGGRMERVMQPRQADDLAALVVDPARIRATLPWVYADLDTIVTHALDWECGLAQQNAQDGASQPGGGQVVLDPTRPRR